ncbi:shavenoid [Haemaphysalis longicornis]
MAPIDPLWCHVNRTQYLSPDGWIESRGSASSGGSAPSFALYRASNRTFLQWLGDESERRTLQHKLLLLRVRCADESGAVFEPCIAFRSGWAPGIAPAERRVTDFTVVGLCLGVLGLVYVLAVLVYLKVRQARAKSTFRSYLNEQPSDPERQHRPHDEQTDAYDTPRGSSAGSNGLGATAATRDVFFKRDVSGAAQPTHGAPSDVRQHAESRSSVRRAALQMNLGPELLEPEMLASPPPPAQEFLAKVREMIAAARTRLRNFRFRPTLVDIPEDDYYQHMQQQHGRLQFAKLPDYSTTTAGGSNGHSGATVRHNPLLGVDCHRFFEVNESFRDSPLESMAHSSPYPPRPPERRRKKASGREAQQARFDLFRKDLYEKLHKLQESRREPSLVRCEPDGNDNSPSYENVLPLPLPKGSSQEAPPRPPPRLCSSPVDLCRPDEVDGDNGSSTSIDLDSLYSPCDSLNSRNICKLSVPPDQTLLEGLEQPIIFGSLHEPRPVYLMNNGPLNPGMILSVPNSYKPSPRTGLYMSVESLQHCIKTKPTYGHGRRGFDAMDALRRVDAGDIEFMHVCRGQLMRRDSVGCSSVASDSLMATPSDSEYDPDYSDSAPQTDAAVVAARRAKRRFRSRAERSGKQPAPPPPDVTIIEVGDGTGDILSGKGNFVTLIELDTSESSN